MSHPILWPRKIFFYAIGNTPPVSLTDHLPPEEDAKILLLGCGDPRNILYTIAVDHGPSNRKMDITCCDLEPAIIARNVLLFTLVIDSIEPDKLPVYWNIFYDLFLDVLSSSLLRQQCDKLMMLATNLDSWSRSCYGNSLIFVTEDSLAEARSHWNLYKTTLDLPASEQQKLKENFQSALKENVVRSPATSPLYAFVPATFMYPESIQTGTAYWKDGITGSKDRSRSLINPTFLFSLAGRKFNLHFGTDVCSSFHMMLAFIKTSKKSANAIPAKTEHDMWAACRAQFSSWCLIVHEKFHTAPQSRSLTIRFVIADALNFCQGLRSYQNGISETTVYKAPWGGSKLHFHDNSTPKFFNVIDTSNLSDHLGLLNILVAARPLMEHSPCSVLHIITLLQYSVHPTERSAVKERALLDFPSISLLLGITPICFFSGLTFRNNAEGSAHVPEDKIDRNYERMLWKMSDFSCTNVPNDLHWYSQRIIIDPKELADKLFVLYLKMFGEENPLTFHDKSNNPNLYLQEPHYNRESFARFVSIVKLNAKLETNWSLVGARFVGLVLSDKQLILGASNYQNLFAELHIHGVYSVPSFHSTPTSTQLFKGWDFVPPLVYVVLMVPRTALAILDVDHNTALECETYVPNGFHHTHSSIRLIFGKLIVLQDGLGTIQEDPLGFHGDSPLLISFPVVPGILAQDPNTRIGLALKYTTSNSVVFFKQLGHNMRIFSKTLTDRDHVFVFRERPDNNGELKEIARMNSVNPLRMLSNSDMSKLSFKDGIGWICKRLSITDHDAKKHLENKAVVSSKQISPCCIRFSFSNSHYSLYFPIPVDHSCSKIRIARKSSYIEIEVPLRTSPLAQVDLQPFPLVSGGPNAPAPFVCWNVPYLNLNRLFSTSSEDLKWAPLHLGLAFSKEERNRYLQLNSSNPNEETTSVIFKSSIRSMFAIFFEGKGVPRILPLFATNISYCFALVFLDCVRIDLSSGSAIGDAVVVIPRPSNALLLQKILTPETEMINCYGEAVHWWRYALPVFAERCRTWKHDTLACEYACASSYPLPLHKTLCSCGKGKDLGPFMDNPKWKALAPYATRVAISTVFPVTYLEDTTFDVGAAFEGGMTKAKYSTVQVEICSKCGGAGKPKLLQCSGCKVTKYCSGGCQQEDWKAHKIVCKNLKK